VTLIRGMPFFGYCPVFFGWCDWFAFGERISVENAFIHA
jgi:hypothetical protein